jgi:hypothetical protein
MRALHEYRKLSVIQSLRICSIGRTGSSAVDRKAEKDHENDGESAAMHTHEPERFDKRLRRQPVSNCADLE